MLECVHSNHSTLKSIKMSNVNAIARLCRVCVDFPELTNECMRIINRLSDEKGTSDNPSQRMLLTIKTEYETRSKLEAVRVWKNTFNTGLMEAKLAVEKHAENLGWKKFTNY